MSKIFLTADDLLLQSFRLAEMIYDSEYRPDIICGVWRGGAPVTIAIHEYFSWHGIEIDHIPVRTRSYYGIKQQNKEIRVDSLEYLLAHIEPGSKLLLVDDVFDSGRSIEAIISAVISGSNIDEDEILVACPWYKPQKNKTSITPDYFVNETEDWIVFPHELKSLAYDEIMAGKPKIAQTLKRDKAN